MKQKLKKILDKLNIKYAKIIQKKYRGEDECWIYKNKKCETTFVQGYGECIENGLLVTKEMLNDIKYLNSYLKNNL